MTLHAQGKFAVLAMLIVSLGQVFPSSTQPLLQVRGVFIPKALKEKR
jgi:hypothetical protein